MSLASMLARSSGAQQRPEGVRRYFETGREAYGAIAARCWGARGECVRPGWKSCNRELPARRQPICGR